MSSVGVKAWRGLGLACFLAVIGCGESGPPLAKVEGQVLLDGAPLPDALVVFQPDQGSPSVGNTNAEGKFNLRFGENRPGPLPGKHTVKITSGKVISKPDGPDVIVPEKVPLKYNEETELTAEVKDGRNELKFELVSGGPVRSWIQ